MVKVNDVLTPLSEAPFAGVARVVRIEPERDLAYIAFLHSRQFPKPVKLSELSKAISALKVAVVTVALPAAAMRGQPTGAIATRQEKAWRAIEPLVKGDAMDRLFDPSLRPQLIRDRAKACKLDLSTLYRLLARYFEGGMTKLALCPRYRSVPVGSEQPDGQRRRGRKAKRPGALRSEFVFHSALRKRIRKFLLEKYTGSGLYDDVCRRLNREFFSIPGATGDDSAGWLPEHQRPSPSQYRHLLKKIDARFDFTKRIDRRAWNLKGRAIKGCSRANIFGPGYEYQVDATGTQVYAVSVIDPSANVGTAIVYFVIDVYSSAIVGCHITLQEESWNAARFALYNAFVPKLEVARRAGLKGVTAEDFPFEGLPLRINGDRGEWVGKQSANVVEDTLGIRLLNARAYRGEDKAIVERLNGTVKTAFLRYLKGATPKHGPRIGAKDPKKQAVHNMRSLTALVYRFIRWWNNRPVSEDAIPEIAIIEAGIEVTPLSIWNWGIANRTGRLRKVDPEALYSHLLPGAEAHMEGDGIHFRRWVYQPVDNGDLWLLSRARKGHYPVTVRFDEGQPDRVWMWVEEKRAYLEFLRRDPNHEYEGWTFEDIEYKHEAYLVAADKSATRSRALKDALDQSVLEAEANAEAEKRAATIGKPRGVLTKHMRTNRSGEHALEHQRLRRLHGIAPKRGRAPVRRPVPVFNKLERDFYAAAKGVRT